MHKIFVNYWDKNTEMQRSAKRQKMNYNLHFLIFFCLQNQIPYIQKKRFGFKAFTSNLHWTNTDIISPCMWASDCL